MGTDSNPAVAVTFALFAFNQERFIREAVDSVLAQACDPMEIIMSDDASSDATFRVMRDAVEAYKGPHHVRLNRNPSNLGLAGHVNKVFGMATGHIIVVAAGDDISLPTRVRDTEAAFRRNPTASMVSFVDEIIDEGGSIFVNRGARQEETVFDLPEFLRRGPLAQRELQISGASRAIRAATFQAFGDLRLECPAEDTPYILRSLYCGPGVVCHWPGIRYRRHQQQLSTERSIVSMTATEFTKQYLADLDVAVEARLVDRRLVRRVRDWVRERELAFRLRRLVFDGRRPSLSMLLAVLRSSRVAPREKVGMVRRLLPSSGLITQVRRLFGKALP